MKSLKQLKIITLVSALTISASTFAATAPQASTSSATFTPKQVKSIEQIVHDYLIQNPNVLVEASQALQKQTAEKQRSFALNAIKENAEKIFDDANSPTVGNPNGSVTLVEFYDYQCGHCKEMSKVIQAVLKSNKNLKIIFKELPIFGDNSKFAARASLASAKQGKFLAFHNALLAADNPLSKDKILATAKQVGLNLPQLEKDMESKAVTQELLSTFKLAEALRVVGTPTFVLSNKAQTQFGFIPGATSQDNLEKEIQQVGA